MMEATNEIIVDDFFGELIKLSQKIEEKEAKKSTSES